MHIKICIRIHETKLDREYSGFDGGGVKLYVQPLLVIQMCSCFVIWPEVDFCF